MFSEYAHLKNMVLRVVNFPDTGDLAEESSVCLCLHTYEFGSKSKNATAEHAMQLALHYFSACTEG